jgi:hypothetical protein
MTTLRRRTFLGLGWSGAAQVSVQAVQFAASIALARLLGPQEFGLIGMVLVFTGFASILLDKGLRAALIQRRDLTDRHVDTVFWINVGVGAVLTSVFVAATPLIAGFYGESSLRALTPIMALTFVPASLSFAQSALIDKALDFRSRFWIETTSAVVSGGLLEDQVTLALGAEAREEAIATKRILKAPLEVFAIPDVADATIAAKPRYQRRHRVHARHERERHGRPVAEAAGDLVGVDVHQRPGAGRQRGAAPVTVKRPSDAAHGRLTCGAPRSPAHRLHGAAVSPAGRQGREQGHRPGAQIEDILVAEPGQVFECGRHDSRDQSAIAVVTSDGHVASRLALKVLAACQQCMIRLLELLASVLSTTRVLLGPLSVSTSARSPWTFS